MDKSVAVKFSCILTGESARTVGLHYGGIPLKCKMQARPRHHPEITTETLIGQNIDHFQNDLAQYATAVFLLEP